MSEILRLHHEALKSLYRGVELLAKAVTPTLGPKRRNIVIRKKSGLPLMTAQGKKVSEEVILKDRFENMGMQLAKSGGDTQDGFTTTIVLIQALFSQGLRQVLAGFHPQGIQIGMHRAVEEVCRGLDEISVPTTSPQQIEQVTWVAADYDAEVGSLVAQAIERSGRDGLVRVASSNKNEMILDIAEGAQLEVGYSSPYFLTDPCAGIVELNHPYVFITDRTIASAEEMSQILHRGIEEGAPSLLVMAWDVVGDALATLVLNKIQKKWPLCAVRISQCMGGGSDFLDDMAVLLGGNLREARFGKANCIKVTKNKTYIIGGQGDPNLLTTRIEAIRSSILSSYSEHEIHILREHLASLTGRVVTIRLGDKKKLKERILKAEMAVQAGCAALHHGVVPGGGVSLIRMAKKLGALDFGDREEQIGLEIVKRACFAPAIAIADNCGKQGKLLAEIIYEREGAWGFNGLTNEFGDLMEQGIIDPVSILKKSFRRAAFIAGTLLNVGGIVSIPTDA